MVCLSCGTDPGRLAVARALTEVLQEEGKILRDWLHTAESQRDEAQQKLDRAEKQVELERERAIAAEKKVEQLEQENRNQALNFVGIAEERSKRIIRAENAAAALRTEIADVRAKWAADCIHIAKLEDDIRSANARARNAEKVAEELRKDVDKAELERLRKETASQKVTFDWKCGELERERTMTAHQAARIKGLETALAARKQEQRRLDAYQDFISTHPISLLNNYGQFTHAFGYPLPDYTPTRLTEDSLLFHRQTTSVSGQVIRKLGDGSIEIKAILTPSKS